MSGDKGVTLIRLARESIAGAFEKRAVVAPSEPWLEEPRAVFVTLRLREDDELRGCVGTMSADRPLGEAVIDYARMAAFEDRRFEPLTRRELDQIVIDVSVLSPLERLPVESEADALAKLGRTRPGVLLTCGDLRAVFLPQVWASFADPREFLNHLKQKAGLPVAFWPSEIELNTFTCEEFAEHDPDRVSLRS